MGLNSPIISASSGYSRQRVTTEHIDNGICVWDILVRQKKLQTQMEKRSKPWEWSNQSYTLFN